MATLQNTLSGQDVRTRQEAELAEIEKQLAERTKLTESQATAAGQQFQTAAAQPQPQLDPMAVFLPTLLSGIASVVAQDPSFRQRAQDQMRQQQSLLLKSREENLAALKEVFIQRADAARRANDLETEAKLRLKIHSFEKEHAETISQQERNFNLELARTKADAEEKESALDRANRLAVAFINQGIDPETGRLFPSKQAGLTTGERRAIIAQGQDPDTNLFLPGFVQKEQAKAAALGRNAKKDADRQNARSRLIDVLSLPQVRDTGDAIKQRLLNARIPWEKRDLGSQKYLITGKNVYKRSGGVGGVGPGSQYVIDEKAKQEAEDEADRLAAGSISFASSLQEVETPTPEVPGGGVSAPAPEGGGNPKAAAIKAARNNDFQSVALLLQQFPELENDPELIKVLQAKNKAR